METRDRPSRPVKPRLTAYTGDSVDIQFEIPEPRRAGATPPRSLVTAIDALIQLCPPPQPPPPPANWDSVEARLGMPLSGDYKQLADVYGPGTFADYIHIFHPRGGTEWVELTGPVPGRVRAQLRHDRDTGSHPVPHPPDALFAFGGTDNGEYLFWVTEPRDDPDHWRIAVNEARGPRWFTFDGALTEFLTRVLNGRTGVPQFPGDLLQQPIAFTPSDPAAWTPPQKPTRPPVASQTIRDWARDNGYDLPDHGRTPAEIRDAWEQAHPHP